MTKDRLVNYDNIYSLNRIGSNETLEGQRSITIGNEFKIFEKLSNKEIFSLNLATSLRDEENTDLPSKSSLGQKMSNIVGEMKFNPSDKIDFNYDFLIDNNLGQINYHKFDTRLKINNFVSSFEFIEENNLVGSESFVANETSLKMSDKESLNFRTRKNKKTDLTEYYNLIYQYKMDCLTAGIEYKKNYYSDGSLKPEESIFFSITLMPFGVELTYQELKNDFRLVKVIKIFLLIFLNLNFSQATEIKILKKINNEIITNFDVELEYNYLVALNNDLRNVSKNEGLKIAEDSLLREKIKLNEIKKIFNREL